MSVTAGVHPGITIRGIIVAGIALGTIRGIILGIIPGVRIIHLITILLGASV